MVEQYHRIMNIFEFPVKYWAKRKQNWSYER